VALILLLRPDDPDASQRDNLVSANDLDFKLVRNDMEEWRLIWCLGLMYKTAKKISVGGCCCGQSRVRGWESHLRIGSYDHRERDWWGQQGLACPPTALHPPTLRPFISSLHSCIAKFIVGVWASHYVSHLPIEQQSSWHIS
jgi:hypothetical protein